MTTDWTVPTIARHSYKKDLTRDPTLEHSLLYFSIFLYYPILWVQGFRVSGLSNAQRVGFRVQERLNP